MPSLRESYFRLGLADRVAAAHRNLIKRKHALAGDRIPRQIDIALVKNLIAQLSLLVTNAEKHKDNPEFQQDMLETLSLSVNKMKRLLEKLSSAGKEENTKLVLLEEVLQQVAECLQQ